MKMRKCLAVLLSAVLLCSLIPAFATTVSADVGTIINGTFETGDLTGWTYYSYSTSIATSPVQGGSYAVRIGSSDTLTGNVALEQIVPVNMNATYSLSFYLRRYSYSWSGNSSFSVSVELGTTASSFTGTGLSATTPTSAASYTKRSYSFSTGSYKYARIRFNCLGSGKDTALDTIALSTTTEGDTSTHAAPALVSFGVEENRPTSSSYNLVTQPGFESTTSAQWNDSNFIKTYLSVVEDADEAYSGSKVLYYNNPGTVESWHEFSVTLSSGGTYVLSAWVRTPHLSSTNTGKASLGIIDPSTDQFLISPDEDYAGHSSTPTNQIRSTATDNDWHLRSVSFYVGAACTVRIGVYGKQSQMYIDDISVHLLTNGTAFVGTQQTATISPSDNSSNMYCEAEDNLIEDCNMTGTVATEFWTYAASGWNNGFLSFETTTRGTDSENRVLKFQGTDPATNQVYNYVKWIYVEPNTSYTVSFDYRITAKGSGSLRFMDNNVALPVAFKTYNFTSTTNDWTTTSFTLNTGVFNRIAILFTDGGGTAYFDDFRIFKTTAGISDEPNEKVYPTLMPTHEGKSRSEGGSETGNGLAFKFELEATGWTCDEETLRYKDGRYDIDYTDAKVQAFEDGVEYTLVKAGAVVTNDETTGQSSDLFVLENVNSAKTVINVEAKKTWEAPDMNPDVNYVVRVINIPDSHVSTVIYARPYYIFEYKGEQVVVYGDVEFDSYTPQTDINDGWLEWD